MNIEQIQGLACKGGAVPKGLTLSERMAFITMKFLYESHRRHWIGIERCRQETYKLAMDFKCLMFDEMLYNKNAAMNNRLCMHLMDISKNGCEHCKKAVSIWNGLDRTDPDDRWRRRTEAAEDERDYWKDMAQSMAAQLGTSCEAYAETVRVGEGA